MPSRMTDTFVVGLLSRLMARERWSQVYLFGAEGEPFWAARMPLEQSEIPLFADALDVIEQAESERPKPFVAHDRHGRFVVAALDAEEDLYVVLVTHDREISAQPVVTDRIETVRNELRPHLETMRREVALRRSS